MARSPYIRQSEAEDAFREMARQIVKHLRLAASKIEAAMA